MNRKNTASILTENIKRHWIKQKGVVKIYDMRIIYDIILKYVNLAALQKKSISYIALAEYLIIYETCFKNEGEIFEFQTLVKIVQNLQVINKNYIQTKEYGKENS